MYDLNPFHIGFDDFFVSAEDAAAGLEAVDELDEVEEVVLVFSFCCCCNRACISRFFCSITCSCRDICANRSLRLGFAVNASETILRDIFKIRNQFQYYAPVKYIV